MKRHVIIISIALFAGILLFTVAYQGMLSARSIPAGQSAVQDADSMKFSHAFHIEQAGVDCATCHEVSDIGGKWKTSRQPTHNSCSSCHEEQITNNCDYCHTNLGEPILRAIAGQRVQHASILKDLHWSHENHVTANNVACVTCHPGVEKVDRVTRANMPTMQMCTDCHFKADMNPTCGYCHADHVNLRPTSHYSSDFKRNHRDFARLGGVNVDCQSCHTETFCQQCHTPGGLKQFGARDKSVDPRSKTGEQDSHSKLNLSAVHELNYRFTHGIDAKARQSECASCHTPQTFCADCHSTGGNINQMRFKPLSHQVAGFALYGRGSGGGLHAREARRDIESCMSCHNVQGQDPTCLTCHTETGGIR